MKNIDFVTNLLKGLQGPDAVGLPAHEQASLPMITNPSEHGMALPELPSIGQPEIQTFGGYEELPPITPAEAAPVGLPEITPDTSIRPRIVEGQTQMPMLGEAPPVAAPTALPVIGNRSLEQELADLDSKQYNKGVWRNRTTGETTSNQKDVAKWGMDAEVVTPEGKDRDKDWSTWDKIASALSGWAQGGLIGGIKAATDRNYFEKMGDENRRAELLPKIGQRQQIEKANQDRVLQQARIADIPADNENRRLQIEAQQEAARARVSSQALGKLTSKKHYDPANLADRKLAEKAGLDPEVLKGWDDRNPVEKTVAGVQYRLNRQTGDYEPTNLPQDEAKTLTTYEIVMPSGERRSYKVSQKDAAAFSTQMTALDARLTASKEMQKSQQDFTADQTRIRNAMTLAVKQYDAAIAGKKALEAEAAKLRLMALKKEMEGLDGQ